VLLSNGTTADLGFTVAVSNFSIAYHEPAGSRPPVPSHYAAAVCLSAGDATSRLERLTVNHPVDHEGWRFYLMSFGLRPERRVVLRARRAPGRPIVFLGMCILWVGVVVMCCRRDPGRERQE
jgi:cytochrome c biogenesis protein ResB